MKIRVVNKTSFREVCQGVSDSKQLSRDCQVLLFEGVASVLVMGVNRLALLSTLIFIITKSMLNQSVGSSI